MDYSNDIELQLETWQAQQESFNLKDVQEGVLDEEN